MGQVFFFACAAALNPTLLAATTVILLLPNPKRLLIGYLLGAMMTSITLGLVIVFSAQDSSAVDTAEDTVSPAVDLAPGGIALAIAFGLAPIVTRDFASDASSARPKRSRAALRGGNGSSVAGPRATRSSSVRC